MTVHDLIYKKEKEKRIIAREWKPETTKPNRTEPNHRAVLIRWCVPVCIVVYKMKNSTVQCQWNTYFVPFFVYVCLSVKTEIPTEFVSFKLSKFDAHAFQMSVHSLNERMVLCMKTYTTLE